MEDSVLWKIRYCGRSRTVEDPLQWKIPYSGRFGTVEDPVLWRIPYCGRFRSRLFQNSYIKLPRTKPFKGTYSSPAFCSEGSLENRLGT